MSQLNSNPNNPRKAWRDDDQRKAFQKSLAEFGDLSGVVFNTTTKRLVGGHKRIEEFRQGKASLSLVEKLPQPDKAGTVAYGHVTLASGVRFAYREVEWNERKEQAAMIAANRWSAEWDFPVLDGMLKELASTDLGFDFNLTGFDSIPASATDLNIYTGDAGVDDPGPEGYQGPYSKEVLSPVYIKTGKKPEIGTLVDTTKRDTLLEQIDKARLKDPRIADFLKLAAQRFLCFDYREIAEFYCHSDKKIQGLMESLALIIVDYNKAIELGFVKLTEELKTLSGQNEALLTDEDENDAP